MAKSTRVPSVRRCAARRPSALRAAPHGGCGRRRPAGRAGLGALLVAAALVGFGPAVAQAAVTPTLYGHTTGWLRLSDERRSNGSGDTDLQLPFYHFLLLGARNLGVSGLSAEVSGMWGVHILDPLLPGVDVATGDLLFGNISYDGFDHRLFVRAGRQHVFTGNTFGAIIDGVHVRGRPVGSLDIGAFIGATADHRFTTYYGGWQFGGRIAYGPWDVGHIGLSYVEERADAPTNGIAVGQNGYTEAQLESIRSATDQAVGRRDVGIDASLRVLKPVEFVGNASIDTVAGRVQQGRFEVSSALPAGFRLAADYGYLWAAGRIPKYSIFWVFAGAQHHRAGLDLTYAGPGLLSASLGGHVLAFDDDEMGYELEAEARVKFRPGRDDSVALQISRFAEPASAYTLVRLSGHVSFLERLRLSADVANYFYDDPMNGYERSHVAYLSADVKVVDRLVLNAGFESAVNPNFDYALAGLFKIVWDFSYDFAAN